MRVITPQIARIRARLFAQLRRFFDTRGYLEVDTPTLSPSLIPEAHIEVFRTEFLHPYDESHELYMVPSPEVWMKLLLAEDFGNIYQLSHCFRNAETLSPIHNPEFTMLEWYSVDADYLDSAELTDSLLAEILGQLSDVVPEDAARRCAGPATRISVAEAFLEYAGLDVDIFGDLSAMRAGAKRLGLSVPESQDPQTEHEELFQRVFLTFVEPRLPTEHPILLTDYPEIVPTLAARTTPGPFSQRWELYLSGVEIANCYTEERDPGRLGNYLEQSDQAKAAATVRHPPAMDLLRFSIAPACSGVALGVDRLLAALLGLTGIQGVIFWPGFSIFRGQSGNRGTT